jgi:hypothetical protein
LFIILKEILEISIKDYGRPERLHVGIQTLCFVLSAFGLNAAIATIGNFHGELTSAVRCSKERYKLLILSFAWRSLDAALVSFVQNGETACTLSFMRGLKTTAAFQNRIW